MSSSTSAAPKLPPAPATLFWNSKPKTTPPWTKPCSSSPKKAFKSNRSPTPPWSLKIAVKYERELARMLKDCHSLLDVGCGSDSPLQFRSPGHHHAVGVDAHAPSVEISRKRGLHDDYRVMNIQSI